MVYNREMKNRFVVWICFAAALWGQAPEARISNGQLDAVLALPDAEKGYYRGARFDWSGIVKSLKYQGHEFFGKWNDIEDPRHHDAIMGPVEEFLAGNSTPGYDEAPVGGRFLRIGVGMLKKTSAEKFERFGRYEVLDAGRWTVKQKGLRVDFRQQLRDESTGYAYDYEKTVRLEKGKPVMWIEHRLRNRGSKRIEVETYNHNFFVIDGEPTGPNLEVEFGFPARAKAEIGPRARLQDGKLQYLEELKKGQTVYSEMEGFRDQVRDHAFRVENRKTGAGVRVRGDRPLAKVIYWSIRPVLSPEPYIKVVAEPGGETSWKSRYEFYASGKDRR